MLLTFFRVGNYNIIRFIDYWAPLLKIVGIAISTLCIGGDPDFCP